MKEKVKSKKAKEEVKSKKEKGTGASIMRSERERRTFTFYFLLFTSVCLCTSAVIAQSGGQFTITKSVIAGGGGRASGGIFTLDGTIGQPLAGGPSSGATFALTSGFWGGGALPAPTQDAPFDFDGDGKTDIGIFRPSAAEWWINRSSTGETTAAQFGASTDIITPADFTGDDKADIAFWRPS